MSGQEIALTVVVPVYNEAESVPELVASVRKAAEALGLAYEILFIDDGSTDGTLRAIEEARRSLPPVKVLSFRRNFGKSAALAVGFHEAKGETIVTMDGDLQDDPAEIGALLRKLDEGYDLVSGWKQDRKDPVTKTLPSKLFNRVVSWASGLRLHDFNCGLKAYRREAAVSLTVYGELHRFLPALAHWNGFRVTEIPVRHHARKYGRTKFGMNRFLNGFLDLLSVMFLNTSARSPLHVFGRLGVLLLAVGGAINLYFAWVWIRGEWLRVRPLLLFGVVLVILGIQFITMGLLAEMIASARAKRDYPVKRRLTGEDDA